MTASVLVKRPVAFRIPRVVDDKISKTEFRYFNDEQTALTESDAIGVNYQALYVRDGNVVTLGEREALEFAIDRMGWPEIHAFQDELRKGQDYREDAGGFLMRAIRRLFGLPSPVDEITTYQQAARAMVEKALTPSPQDTAP